MPWLMLLSCIVVVDGKPQRQMLSSLLTHGGRSYCHSFIVTDGKPHKLHAATFEGRCYCQVADGIATIGWVISRCYYHIGR